MTDEIDMGGDELPTFAELSGECPDDVAATVPVPAKKGGKGRAKAEGAGDGLMGGTPMPRVGKLEKARASKAATVKPGERAVPAFNPAVYAEDRLDAWWQNGSNTYYIRNKKQISGDDGWLELNGSQLDEELMSLGLRVKDFEEGGLSEVQKVKLYIRRNRAMETSLCLAGYDAGVYTIQGQRILVRKSAQWIEPKKGDWPILAEILERMFVTPLEGEGEQPLNFLGYLDAKLGREKGRARAREVWKLLAFEKEGDCGWFLNQRVIFLSWLKLRLDVYRTLRKDGMALKRNAQALVMAGAQDAGKGFLQNYIITPLLGGRQGLPEDVLFGRSAFNKDLFGTEHLSMEEMPTETTMASRLLFGEMLKSMVTKSLVKYHPKGKDGINLTPVWTISISVNDDADRLRAFPPVTNDLADKILMLHAGSGAMPSSTVGHEEYVKFGRSVEAELPAFLHYLLHEFQIPTCLLDGRFGMLAFHAPDLVKALFDDTPAGSFLELLCDSRFGASGMLAHNLWGYEATVDCKWVKKHMPGFASATDEEIKARVWTGKAHELQAILEAEENTLHRHARDLFKYNRVERLLGRLEQEEPSRAKAGRTRFERFWCIVSPMEDDVAVTKVA